MTYVEESKVQWKKGDSLTEQSQDLNGRGQPIHTGKSALVPNPSTVCSLRWPLGRVVTSFVENPLGV